LIGCSAGAEGSRLEAGVDEQQEGHEGFDGAMGGGGSGPPESGQECTAVSQQADNEIRPVDIIWAVDTSPSMTLEKNAVRDNLNVFAQQITAAQIDVHVVLISELLSDGGICVAAPLGSGQCPGDHNPPNFHHEPDWVGSHNALGRFLGEYPDYKASLRQNALKYFAVVTDDGAETDAATFTAALASLDPGWFDEWKLFGMFCGSQDSGGTYQTLVNQTGGVAVELCQVAPNWQDVFDGLVQTVLSNVTLDCEWEIPPPPQGQQFVRDQVNVEYTPGSGGPAQPIYHVDSAADCGPGGGWYYDDNASPTHIRVCPETCTLISGDLSGRVDILFGCATLLAPR
ncbi:MAG: hypothetical protein JRI23_14500, partial [Deltaproteobacteria bacterium]|nr:hypothetical protein [Deltaproteobacteria bacterium]MBW2532959.1 hypothetical protein [Deltaproteobacteria bacterium]